MQEIRALAQAGIGILFTTHDPNHALRAANRAYLLRGGTRLAEGPVADVLRRERLEDLYAAPVGSGDGSGARPQRLPARMIRRLCEARRAR